MSSENHISPIDEEIPLLLLPELNIDPEKTDKENLLSISKHYGFAKNIDESAKNSNKSRRDKKRKAGKVGPPRPLNSYFLYMNVMRGMIPKIRRKKHSKDVSRILAENWKREPARVREYFKIFARYAKKKHGESYPGYRFKRKIKKAVNLNVEQEKELTESLADSDFMEETEESESPVDQGSTEQMESPVDQGPMEQMESSVDQGFVEQIESPVDQSFTFAERIKSPVDHGFMEQIESPVDQGFVEQANFCNFSEQYFQFNPIMISIPDQLQMEPPIMNTGNQFFQTPQNYLSSIPDQIDQQYTGYTGYQLPELEKYWYNAAENAATKKYGLDNGATVDVANFLYNYIETQGNTATNVANFLYNHTVTQGNAATAIDAVNFLYNYTETQGNTATAINAVNFLYNHTETQGNATTATNAVNFLHNHTETQGEAADDAVNF